MKGFLHPFKDSYLDTVAFRAEALDQADQAEGAREVSVLMGADDSWKEASLSRLARLKAL